MKKKEKIQTILCDNRQATQKIMYNGGNKDLDFKFLEWV